MTLTIQVTLEALRDSCGQSLQTDGGFDQMQIIFKAQPVQGPESGLENFQLN